MKATLVTEWAGILNSASPLSSSTLSPSAAAICHFKEQASPWWVAGSWVDIARSPCQHTAGHHKRGAGNQDCIIRYLHIGLLCVHELLDYFSEAICIREVASQWPRRRVLTLPWSFHAVGLGVVKIPTQRGDLLSTLGGNKRHRTSSIIISRPPRTRGLSSPSVLLGVSQDIDWGYPASVISNPAGYHSRFWSWRYKLTLVQYLPMMLFNFHRSCVTDTSLVLRLENKAQS